MLAGKTISHEDNQKELVILLDKIENSSLSHSHTNTHGCMYIQGTAFDWTHFKGISLQLASSFSRMLDDDDIEIILRLRHKILLWIPKMLWSRFVLGVTRGLLKNFNTIQNIFTLEPCKKYVNPTKFKTNSHFLQFFSAYCSSFASKAVSNCIAGKHLTEIPEAFSK